MNYMSTDSIRNPLTGKLIKINGTTHQKLISNGTLSRTQSGGNPIIAGLPTLTQLAIPVGLTAASYFAHDYLAEPPTQTGGQSKSKGKDKDDSHLEKFPYQKAGNPLISAASQLTTDPEFVAQTQTNSQKGGNLLKTIADLSVPVGLTWAAHQMSPVQGEQKGGNDPIPVPIIDNDLLKSYLSMNKIKKLTPETLIPLGIILAIFAEYQGHSKDQKSIKKGDLSQEIGALVDRDDWIQYTKSQGLKEVTSQTKVPFAVLMGPDIFHHYVSESKK